MFIYTLPILFTYTHYLKPMEFSLILMAGLAILWSSAPLSTGVWLKPRLNNYLLSAWLGYLGLHWACWPFFILLNLCLHLTDNLAKSGLLTVSSWDEIHFVLMLCVVWWTTAVWRCSANTFSRFWAGLARLATLAVWFEYALKLLIRIDYPRVFFNCEDLLLDYGSCF
ncbi:MAG: hypothetical protein ABL925_20895 [Methylococcales bacterium]